MNKSADSINAKERFALGASKNSRSTQYSMTQRNMDKGIARRTHDFPLKMLHRSTPPTMIQPAPVMDKYGGLRRAPNSFKTFHQRNAANSRTAPQADRLNTSHRSRVTLKGRFWGMDSAVQNNRFRLRKGRSIHVTEPDSA